jgi:endonuclease III
MSGKNQNTPKAKANDSSANNSPTTNSPEIQSLKNQLPANQLSADHSPADHTHLTLRHKAIAIHKALCTEYGCPIPYFHTLDPLSELVSALLSHRTKNRDSDRAFKQLAAQFPTWEAVCNAPTKAVEQAIAPCTWAEQKAPRIQQVLQLIYPYTQRFYRKNGMRNKFMIIMKS